MVVSSRVEGRDEQLDLLLEHSKELQAGRGHIFSIIGEAGIGKTQLAYEYRNKLEGQTTEDGVPITFHRVAARAFREQTEYWLITRLMYRIIDTSPHANIFTVYMRLREFCKSILEDNEYVSVYPYLAYLIDPNMSGKWGDWIKSLPRSIRRNQIHQSLLKFFVALAKENHMFLYLIICSGQTKHP